MKQKRTSLLILSATVFTLLINSCSKDVKQSQITANTTDNVVVDNLVALYTFNGDTKDHSGNNNDVDFNSAIPTAGKDGVANTAYLFNGTSSYMTVPNSASINPSGAITIVATIQPQGFYMGQCHSNRVICKGYNDYDNGRYAIGYDDQPYWQYQGCDKPVKENKQSFYGTYGNGQATATGITDLAIHVQSGKWYTLVYTYDGKRSKFYVNGVLQAGNVKSTSFTGNSNPLFIGRNQDPSFPYFFNGIIDELRIYNAALSQSKIQQLNP